MLIITVIYIVLYPILLLICERELSDPVERDGYNGKYIFQPYEVADAASRLSLINTIAATEFSRIILNMRIMICLCTSPIYYLALLCTDLCLMIFLMGKLIHIPKGSNVNVTALENYRGITLSSVFGRILDSIILSRYASLLVTFDLQFGFERKRSTAMCTMVVK
jgi:hypothetical protein